MGRIIITILQIITYFICIKAEDNINIDPLGYILYCPCMGRFGNQADHFLGSFAFAKGLNRTLVLPPWVEYRYGEPKSLQIPFDEYFQVEPLLEYHRVITMEKFMENIAPKIWPADKRISFCYTARAGGIDQSCNAKDGNPFGPFWDTFDVDFINSEFYGPLHYNIYEKDMVKRWIERYSPSEWPVLAFTGAPASFPVQDENRKLQKYLKWKDLLKQQAQEFIKTNLLKGGGFIGIHLRNGIDWVRACDHIKQTPNLFAAPQCLGYRNENGFANYNMCMPSQKTIVKQLKRLIRNIRPPLVSVFVASDSDHMLSILRDALKKLDISVTKLEPPNPHLELAILGLSNHFVGNCISSFSAFVKRERDAKGLPSSFWDFPQSKTEKSHEEL